MKRSLPAILTLLLALVAASAATAAEPADNDCHDGRIDGTYTQAEYQRALREIPTDVDEYTDCRGVIRRAQLAAARRASAPDGGGGAGAGAGAGGGPSAGAGASGGGGSGGTGAAFRSDPLAQASADERRVVQEATAAGGGPVTVAGAPLRPGGAGADGATHDVPAPLLVLLVLLAVAAAGFGATAARSRVVARRPG